MQAALKRAFARTSPRFLPAAPLARGRGGSALWNTTALTSSARGEGSWRWAAGGARSMFIQTENTPNPDSLKFVPDGNVVLESGTMDFPDARSSLSSPLAKSLFTIAGVQRVFFGNDFITVTKKPDVDWHEIKAQIFANIMDFYASGESAVSEQQDTSNTAILPTDSETVAMIKELLEVRIRPSVQEDGGDIEYKGFDEEAGVVYLKMVGSCSGCPSSSVTLKSGIERMLMHWIKEVTGVVAVESDDELDRLTKQEFAKLEKRLGEEGKGDDTAKESSVA